MTAGHASSSRRVLESVARIAEVLFGLIMALTFTHTMGARVRAALESASGAVAKP